MTIKEQLNNQFGFKNDNLLKGLSSEVYQLLTANLETYSFKAGNFIFKEGEKPKGIYRIKTGKVKKFTHTNFGAQHIFYVCKEQEYLGYHAILSEEYYQDSAAALTDGEIDFIPKADFEKAVNTCHLLSQRLLKNLSHEFGVFIKTTKLLAKHTVRERAALTLLILEGKYANGSTHATEIIIQREDLASMVGTAKESVVRMLKDFKDEQLITTKRSSIFIRDYEGLVKVANLF
ncbi:Crp/Fnr family transcriptional regulator [Winogradskyella schleiferi]|uniref:Crp/Fnr family transcriptional regulator n=1 Tax=Winogradskyella schleiferi TaxID=2686078 RepID=UPI0015BE8187|nr:Crp/Fnr family transcriptional regulator [Winogradskyella schleiferi]